MILATSQDATSASIAVGGSGGSNALDLLDYTFDTNYLSGTATQSFDIDLDAQNTIYVGMAGHNLGTLGCTVSINNHGTTTDINPFIPLDDRPIMLAIPARSGGAPDAVRIEITKPNSTDVVILSHCATGQYTDFTSITDNGQILLKDYQANYPRIPMGLGRKTKAILNQSASPTATLIKTVSQKVKLNIANVATNFAQVDLVQHQYFWTENAFFYSE